MTKPLDPNMPTQQLKMYMGELTASEVRVARAAIAWANREARNVVLDSCLSTEVLDIFDGYGEARCLPNK